MIEAFDHQTTLSEPKRRELFITSLKIENVNNFEGAEFK
jgi:hypothetical protein